MSSITFPFVERWRRQFDALDKPSRVSLLTAVRECWVGKQGKYFTKSAHSREEEHKKCHFWGWSFVAGGIINIVGHLVSELSHTAHIMLVEHGMAVALVLAVVGLDLRRQSIMECHPHDDIEDSSVSRGDWISAIFHHKNIWGAGCMIAATVICGAFTLDQIKLNWPGFHNWWIILTSVAMLTGGFWFAWAERNFLSEETRNFRAMQDLFGCADRRLTTLISRYAGSTDKEEKRLLEEIQFIIYQLGCEALDENAEWLILHRARPLEPFLAG